MSEPLLCLTCPVCGEPPQMAISPQQAFCGTNGCRIVMFSMTRTAEDQLAGPIHEVKLTRDDL